MLNEKEIDLDVEIGGIATGINLTPKDVKQAVNKALDRLKLYPGYEDKINALCLKSEDFYDGVKVACHKEESAEECSRFGWVTVDKSDDKELEILNKFINEYFEDIAADRTMFVKELSPTNAYFIREILMELQRRVSVIQLDQFKLTEDDNAISTSFKARRVKMFFETGSIFDVPQSLVEVSGGNLVFSHQNSMGMVDRLAASTMLGQNSDYLDKNNFNKLIEKLKNPDFMPNIKLPMLTEAVCETVKPFGRGHKL